MVWYSHLFQNFPQFIVIYTVKGFGIVNKAEVDVFLELSCFFDDPADVGNLISGWTSLVAQRLKRLPAMRETWVLSLGREDPLEKGMATHSGILAWRIPWTEEPSGLQSMGSQRVDTTERLHFALKELRFRSLLQNTSLSFGYCYCTVSLIMQLI